MRTFALVWMAMLLPGTVALAQQATAPQHVAVQTAAPRLQVFQPTAVAPPGATATGKRNLHAKLTVNAAATDWTDTGIPVLPGDTLRLTASGSIRLAGHTLTPDGMTRGWRDMLRRFPVDTADAGALVGRIGTSAAAVPFSVGTQGTVTAAQGGNLFLRVNTSQEVGATGSVHVDLRITPRAAAAASTALEPNAFAALAPATLDALPRRVTDRDGTPGDAINFALLGTEQQVRDDFARAGWVAVDADTESAIVHGLLNTLQHKPYLAVPMSLLYMFGRPQDMSFARASAISVATDRHHLRCWNSGISVGGVPLWIGAATHDVGLERDSRNGQVTHRIAPEIDLERDFLRDSFQASGTAAAVAYFTPSHPVHEAHTATGGSFTTDGRMLVVQLR